MKSGKESKSKKTVKEIKKTKSKQKPEIKIVTSEKWDAGEAGLEISEKLAEIKDISFVMLFSTNQYHKHGGFKKLLKNVYRNIDKNIPLAGGSVLGFMTSDNCYTQGVVCLVFSYKNMDVAISYYKNTKRNPKKAGEKTAKKIEQKLADSKYKNKFLFSFISGSQMVKLPYTRPKVIIPFMIPDKIISFFMGFLRLFFQKGFGQEDDVLNSLCKNLKNYSVFGTSMGGSKLLLSYQFFNNKVLKNSIVALGISSDFNNKIEFASGSKESHIKFKITKMSKDRRIIHEINGRPAVDELIRLMGWQKSLVLDEKRWTDILPRFPLGYYDKNKNIILRPLVMIIGNSLGFMSRIESDEAFIALMSGKDILSATDEFELKKNCFFSVFNSCGVRAMGLGKSVNNERLKIGKIFKDRNFLLLYTVGEACRQKNEPLVYLNESIARWEIC